MLKREWATVGRILPRLATWIPVCAIDNPVVFADILSVAMACDSLMFSAWPAYVRWHRDTWAADTATLLTAMCVSHFILPPEETGAHPPARGVVAAWKCLVVATYALITFGVPFAVGAYFHDDATPSYSSDTPPERRMHKHGPSTRVVLWYAAIVDVCIMVAALMHLLTSPVFGNELGD